MFRTLWALTKGHAVRPTLSRPETWLLAATAALLLLALLGPAIAQPAAYHQFADRRAFSGLPFAMDVLSNLPFAIAGLAGMACLWRLPRGAIGNIERAMAWLFFGGLLLTAVAKALELLDADIFALTGQLVSGHTLKHLVAALAAVPVIVAVGGLGNWRQNRPRPPATMTTASPGPLGE